MTPTYMSRQAARRWRPPKRGGWWIDGPNGGVPDIINGKLVKPATAAEVEQYGRVRMGQLGIGPRGAFLGSTFVADRRARFTSASGAAGSAATVVPLPDVNGNPQAIVAIALYFSRSTAGVSLARMLRDDTGAVIEEWDVHNWRNIEWVAAQALPGVAMRIDMPAVTGVVHRGSLYYSLETAVS